MTNPASTFDYSVATTRLGHYIGRNNIANFSFGGPNDSFNRRKQVTYSIGDNVNWTLKQPQHQVRRRIQASSIRHEPARGTGDRVRKIRLVHPASDRQRHRSRYAVRHHRQELPLPGLGFYVTDNWKMSRKLSLNLGLRYELFMWPTEKNGRIGNFDLEPFLPCFAADGRIECALRQSDARFYHSEQRRHDRAFRSSIRAIGATQVASNKHTLNGQDYEQLRSAYRARVCGQRQVRHPRRLRAVLRPAVGVIYQHRILELSVPPRGRDHGSERQRLDPDRVLGRADQYSAQPMAAVPDHTRRRGRRALTRSATTRRCLSIRAARRRMHPGRRATRRPAPAVFAETSPKLSSSVRSTANLKTPYVHQWNVGVQYEIVRRTCCSKLDISAPTDSNLLIATALNQGFDLNDPNTPDHIFERFNQAYVAAGAPNGPLNAGSTARERGLGRAFGFLNTVTGADRSEPCRAVERHGISTLRPRADPRLQRSRSTAAPVEGYSDYHGGQFSLTKRLSRGLQFNVAYTFSKSIDIMSTDPGSTAGGGKPDVPNSGFIAQGDSRNLENNKALSDFDRTHRFSTNFVWEIPTGGSNNAFVKGWSISGFFQAQSGTPFTVFASEPEIADCRLSMTDLTRGSGGLYRLGLRPSEHQLHG